MQTTHGGQEMILGFKKVFQKTKTPTGFIGKIILGRKIHSIRAGSRWKAGMKIHFATGVRTPLYNQFNTGVVISVQKISISPPVVHKDGYRTALILIDGKGINEYTKSVLASNDGFDSIDDFWNWFDKGIRGQIIHWTNFKY